MTHHQIDSGELGGLLRIIGSIATIIALYTGMMWYVFHIYFGQVMTKLNTFEQHINESIKWKMEHNKETGAIEQEIVDLNKRIDRVEVVTRRTDKTSALR